MSLQPTGVQGDYVEVTQEGGKYVAYLRIEIIDWECLKGMGMSVSEALRDLLKEQETLRRYIGKATVEITDYLDAEDINKVSNGD